MTGAKVDEGNMAGGVPVSQALQVALVPGWCLHSQSEGTCGLSNAVTQGSKAADWQIRLATHLSQAKN